MTTTTPQPPRPPTAAAATPAHRPVRTHHFRVHGHRRPRRRRHSFGVLPYASEARVVGAALLAFAAGWALLAWLTTRYTNRPQRWAYVPPAALAASGALLARRQPGRAGHEPPRVGVGTRPRRPRRLESSGAPAATCPAAPGCSSTRSPLAMLLAGLGGLYQATTSGDPRTAAGPMPGRLVDVGGYRLHLNCTGTGSPDRRPAQRPR